jgi:adenosine deaminase
MIQQVGSLIEPLQTETTTITVQPTFKELVALMKAVRKVELHLHLGGAWPLDFLQKIAEAKDFAATCDFLEKIKSGIDYHDGFQIFGLFGKIVNTDQKVEEGVVALCKNLAEDNVVLAEVRTGLKDLGSGLEGYLKAVLRGIERGSKENNIKIGLILSLRRDTPEKIAEETVDLAIKHRSKGIVGFDLSGDSTAGDGFAAVIALKRAHAAGLPIALHIGESSKETKAQQLLEFRELKPNRVGHCVHLAEEAKQWILANQIPIEMCLTSAVKLKMIEAGEAHPALRYFKEGHPVVVCSDDTAIFQVSLSEECAFAAQLGIRIEQIKELQETAKQYSFLKE